MICPILDPSVISSKLHLSYRIPLITGCILILTAIVNIGAFRYFSDIHFSKYVEEISFSGGGDLTPDPKRIQALLQIGKLNQKDQKDYIILLSELANLSTSIENISKNPELYMSNKSASGDSMISIPQFHSESRVLPTLDFAVIGQDSPEGRMVTGILQGLIIANILWLFLVLFLYFLWIRSIFRPIRIITENIQNIIERKRYASIRYTGKNEFTPLISTINNLHKSLSIQEKIRSDFLSDISHEIRTPITAVKCYLEGIEDGVMKLDLDTVGLLSRELGRLTSITESIMQYASLTNEAFSNITVERFSVSLINDEIIAQYLPQLQKSHQSITQDMPQDTTINMDKGMYIQVLHNIISNFIKYAGEDTTLNLSYKKAPKEYIFTFSDNGIGIPEEELAFVKEKFYRVDKSRTQSDGSMGIGLSIIDRIARLHHGSLTLEKNHPKGVKFVVKIGR